jgi:flagellar biosynthesis/type III secretory pathway protein FliH
MDDHIEDDDDDDFFGNQEEDEDESYGGLSKHELKFKEEEMKKIAFLQSYDQTAEAKIQEGFEAGYHETFDSAFRIGLLLGELATSEKFKQDNTTDATQSSSLEVSRQVRTFVTSFQERANNKTIDDAKSELENFEKELPETSEG